MSKNQVRISVESNAPVSEKELDFISEYFLDEIENLLGISVGVLNCLGNWTISGNINLIRKGDSENE